MQVLYKSTRGKEETVTASMAILKGLSEDGGLFVPTEIRSWMSQWMSWQR